jgi:hypothetical protein
MRNQSGFSIVEGFIIVVVIGLIGGVGYLAYTNLLAPKPTETAATVVSPSPSSSTAPVKVSSASDLSSVSNQLDSIAVDDSDSATLDTNTNF